jgi:hypothetical protein
MGENALDFIARLLQASTDFELPKSSYAAGMKLSGNATDYKSSAHCDTL